MEEAEFKCDVCGKVFKDRSGPYKHKKKKNPCAPKTPPPIKEANIDNPTLVDKIKTLVEENLRLKSIVDNNERINNLVENMQHNVEDIKYIKTSVKDLCANQENAYYKNIAIQQNTNIQNNNNKNKNKNLNFTIKLAMNDKERYDHIPKEQILDIFNQSDFSRSVADLVEAVHFNPKAPENMTWCIGDKTAASGAFEYNHETNSIVSCYPTTVITKSLQNILFGMGEVFEELREASVFNDQQGRSYQRYFNLIGQDEIPKEYIASIKNMAYESRTLPLVIWNYLNIGMVPTKVTSKLMSKVKTI